VLTKKRKISKREMKEDQLVTTYFKTVQFIKDYQKKILIYAGSVIVVVLLVIGYKSYQGSRNEKANFALSKVIGFYDSGAYQEAIDGRPGAGIEGLKAIVDKYGSTENGEIAKIYLGDCYNMLGKFDDAYKYYDDYSGSIDVFKAAAKAGIGSFYESKKQFKEAAEAFKDAASVSKINPSNAEYLYKAGIDFLEANNKEEANELFKKVKDDYKTSAYARSVDRYLAVTE
jgi:tetratricopeptide (TPR) repeat protein